MTAIQNHPSSASSAQRLPRPLRVVRVVPEAAAVPGRDVDDVRVELSRPLTDLERDALELLAARRRRA